jgi:BRCA1-associated protein
MGSSGSAGAGGEGSGGGGGEGSNGGGGDRRSAGLRLADGASPSGSGGKGGRSIGGGGGGGGTTSELEFEDDDDDGGKGGRNGGGGRSGGGGGWLDDGLDGYDEDYPLDPGMEEALVSSKLDAIHTEYNQLLTNQLDGQRRYFEGMMAMMQAEKDGLLSAAETAEKQAALIAGAVQDARDARQSLKEAHKTIDGKEAKIAKLEEEKEFLKSLNETLLVNQKSYKTMKKETEDGSESKLRERDAKIHDLEEQVRDLMLFLDAQSKIEQATAEGEEIEGGTVIGVGDGEVGPSRGAAHGRLQSKLASRKKSGGG